jgi:hypothetical protein
MTKILMLLLYGPIGMAVKASYSYLALTDVGSFWPFGFAASHLIALAHIASRLKSQKGW